MSSQEEIFHYNVRHGSAEGVLALIEQIHSSDPGAVSYFVNRRNSMRYTPLHTAIFARNLGTCKVLLQSGHVDVDLKCHGTPALHLVLNTAALPGGREFADAIFPLLLEQERIDLSARDDAFGTALHVACEYNLVDYIKLLLAAASGSSEGQGGGVDVDAKDRTGLRPLHRAASRDAAEAALLLVQSGKGVQLNPQTPYGSTPLHLAAVYSSPKVWKVLVEAGADATGIKDCWSRSAVELLAVNGWKVEDKKGLVIAPDTAATKKACSLSAPTAIITHSICRRHYTCEPSDTETPSAPPENVKRLHVVIDDDDGSLRGSDLAPLLHWVPECRAAAMGDVLRVHEWPYVRKIQGFCETIPKDPEGEGGIGSLDGDTTLCHDSFNAALHAAGAVIEGVDMVCKGQSRNAFAPVRPPGHHAGPKGLVKGKDGGPDSHGFCLLNNVSIGAAYALNVHRDTVKRVAIVDFDVHHGNGTEETIRWLKPGVDDVGLQDLSCFGSLAMPRYKPWFDSDDTDNVLFVSVHGYGPRERGLEHLMPQAAFYPGSGKTHVPEVTTPALGGALGGSASDESLAPPPSMLQRQESKTMPAFSPVRSGKGGNEDDDEDEDDENEDEDDDEDEDDEDNMEINAEDLHALYEMQGDNNSNEDDDNDATAGASSRLHKKIAMTRKLFTRVPRVSKVRGRESVPPLILDVGVPLPENEEVTSGDYRHQWRNYFREKIFPSMVKFKPDLVLISAGFDAHKKDTINGGYIALVEEDFEWVTANLVKVANGTCGGKVVSVLEGGYQILGEHCSAFAKSVKAHVAALASGARNVAPYSLDDAKRESDVERRLLDEAAERRAQKLLLQQQREEAVREARRAAAAAELAAQQAAAGAGAEGESAAVEAEAEAEGEGDGSSRKRRRAQVS
jgi:acetoin utilization deacetylase AcuC-like enzyme/ankyrin repeat protein